MYSGIPKRWVTVLISLFGLFNAFSMRVCLSIAITQMVIPTDTTIESIDDTCSGNGNVNDTQNKNDTMTSEKLFDWSEYTQGIILSSFYWSYLFTNLVGGSLAEKFGGKHTLGFGILSTAVLTLLTPVTIMWGGSIALICLRVLMGLGEGVTYPALNVLLAQWIPEDERSKAGSLVYAGAPLGSIFGMLGSGLILQYSSAGWPLVFYFFGIAGILSFVLNTVLCYSKPSEHPSISDKELKYLKEKLKNTHAELPTTPWKHILTSKPVWALVAVNLGNAWGFFTIASDMPKYMSSVLKFSVQNNGYFSSVPYLCMWIFGFIASSVADSIIAKGQMPVGKVRKIGSTICSLGPGIFIVAASYAGCDGLLVVVLLTIGLTLKGCSYFSILINALDLGPNFSGTLMGLHNGVATLGGIMSPYIVGVLTPNQTLSEWRLVFWIVFVFYIVSNIIFIIYGSGELQEWNDPNFLNKEKKSIRNDVKEKVELLTIK